MSKFSISLTLGKASAEGGANIEHNNRDFIANNVDVRRIFDNLTYVRHDVRDAYEELFGEALKEYNAKQKQPCRRIDDYFDHIMDGKREEAYYEVIVQFGDVNNCAIGSENAETAKKMLDTYIRGWKQRNPNLYICNAVLHADEATPHIHIDFIPFYTKGRKNGLSKGVSMKAALNEQGFTAKNSHENQLVSWEESERSVMEKVLKQYGHEREIKHANYPHLSVGEYKRKKDTEKLSQLLGYVLK